MNKENDKQEDADSNIRSQTMLVQTFFEILSAVVSEKSLTQISLSYIWVTVGKGINRKREK